VSVPLLPYSSTRRSRLHCALRIFLNPRTGPGTRCDFGQNGQTKRVPCAFGIRSTTTAHPGLHSLYSTGSGGATGVFTAGFTGLLLALATGRLADARFAGRASRFAALRLLDARRLALRPDRVVLVARMISTLTRPLAIAAWSRFVALLPNTPNHCLELPLGTYGRRCTICLSVRLLCRVFLPNVGNAHGVCG